MKRVSIVLTICSLVVALLSIAAAPMASGNATLASVVYVEGKGIVFTFHVDGKLSKSELKGSVQVDGGGNYGLDCVQVDDSTVKCTASQAIAGANVVVTWGGSSFWTKAPQPPVPAEYCYGIWSWWTQEQIDAGWHNFGPHCQDAPAQEGDDLWYTVPEGTFPGQPSGLEEQTWFVDDPDFCEVPNHGSAYYWAPWCFSAPE